MSTRASAAASAEITTLRDRLRGRRVGHLHWYRWAAEASFDNGSLYACRCGSIRRGL